LAQQEEQKKSTGKRYSNGENHRDWKFIDIATMKEWHEIAKEKKE